MDDAAILELFNDIGSQEVQAKLCNGVQLVLHVGLLGWESNGEQVRSKFVGFNPRTGSARVYVHLRDLPIPKDDPVDKDLVDLLLDLAATPKDGPYLENYEFQHGEDSLRKFARAIDPLMGPFEESNSGTYLKKTA